MSHGMPRTGGELRVSWRNKSKQNFMDNFFFIIYKFNIMEYLQNDMPDAVRVVCADDEADIRSWRFYIRKETRSCTYDDSLMTFLKVEGHFLETLEQNLTRHAMQPPFLSK